jgi:hypothetical protein
MYSIEGRHNSFGVAYDAKLFGRLLSLLSYIKLLRKGMLGKNAPAYFPPN